MHHAIVLSTLSLVACAAAPARPLTIRAEPPPMEVLEANRLSNRLPQGPRISVRRTGCLGACPDYTVTIRPDGHVEFEGRAFVATAGASDRVPEADARQMLERLDRIDFFHLDDCVGMLDVPQLIVEVQTGNGSHRVIATEGCTGPGIAELRLTARELEDTIRSQRWVGSVVPCGLVIDERIYFSSVNTVEVSVNARVVLADIAVVLRKFGIPTSLVASRGSGEPPTHAIARATAVRDVLTAAGVATSSMRVESSATITSGSPSVSVTIDVPRCEPGQAWIVMPRATP